jgi:Tol biopolymer transport system component
VLGGITAIALAIPVLVGAWNSPPVAPNQLVWVESYRPPDGHVRDRLVLGVLDNPKAATEVPIRGCAGTNGCFIGDPAISPDGRRIAFRMAALTSQGTNDGPYDVHIVDVLSNRTWQVTFTSEDSGNPAYSPNGRWLAFDQGRAIYKADLCGGGWQAGRRLRGGEHPSWSPGGQDIVFESQNDILIMDNDGQNVRGLVTQGRNHDPVWMKPGATGSRGALIAFSTSNGIRMIDSQGNNLTPLTSRATDRSPDWPANIPLFVVYETSGSEIWYGNNSGTKKLANGRNPSTGYPRDEIESCPR